jgi:hypothetical protein
MIDSTVEPRRPYVVCNIKFLTAQEGGRHSNTPDDKLHCMFELEGSLYDCRLLLSSVGSVPPGAEFEAAIIFLDPNAIIPKLHVGFKFLLRDPRTIAYGTVLSIEKA